MKQAAPPRTSPVRAVIRKIAGILAECAYAQRRMTELTTAPDRYIADPAAPPQTYAEFLYRTSGVLQREPSARSRAGRPAAAGGRGS
jgi:hypothetical protein